MKRDIETRSDIEELLAEFYKIVPFDAQIGHHFKGLNLEQHLPTIACPFCQKSFARMDPSHVTPPAPAV